MNHLIWAVRSALRPRNRARSLRDHLAAAVDWLRRAQDAVGGEGVSRSYALRHMRAHGRRGWLGAYPETTGYIIPTFFDYATLTGDPDDRRRALAMADWESRIQMESGAVQGGTVDFAPTPAIFNTGQVLFGWARAYRDTGEPRYLDSARRAADFLTSALDDDGAWRSHGSSFARPGVNVYDARSAWGLAVASRATRSSEHERAAVRNLDFVLTRQRPNGWFDDCCLDDNERPLLHTIAYTMEGLLESGVLLGNPRYIEAARRPADALLSLQRSDGSLAGRFRASWEPACRWSCLTGDAQTAIVWGRLFELTGERRYRDAAARANRYLMSLQDLDAADEGIRGGIAGSDPIWGEYGTYEYLNWAAKFFADSLLLELKLDSGTPRS